MRSPKKELGKTLKEARGKAKLTQEEVADKTNMTTNYYAMIERGEVNPSFEKLRMLFKFLKISSSQLPL